MALSCQQNIDRMAETPHVASHGVKIVIMQSTTLHLSKTTTSQQRRCSTSPRCFFRRYHLRVLHCRPKCASFHESEPISSKRALEWRRTATAETTGNAFTMQNALKRISESTPTQPISLTEKALSHLKKLQAEHQEVNLLFRVGVRSGGCSGLSYIMDFESQDNIKADDAIFEYENGSFKMVCDPKSLLYLFGMRLDYSDALIGGGFQFHNPNATDTCGCGKSFGV